MAQHLPSKLAAFSPPSRPPCDTPRTAPPAQHPAPPTLPEIRIPPSRVLPLVPPTVVEEYALSSLPPEILSLRPEYKRLVQDGTLEPITHFPKWLLEWCMIIEMSAVGALSRDDKDRAALREYEAYRLAAEAFPAEFDEEVVRKVQEEEEVLKDRIWLRWERLLGALQSLFFSLLPLL